MLKMRVGVGRDTFLGISSLGLALHHSRNEQRSHVAHTLNGAPHACREQGPLWSHRGTCSAVQSPSTRACSRVLPVSTGSGDWWFGVANSAWCLTCAVWFWLKEAATTNVLKSVALWNMVLVDRQSLDACDLVHIVGRESGVPRRRVALERFTRGNCPVLL